MGIPGFLVSVMKFHVPFTRGGGGGSEYLWPISRRIILHHNHKTGRGTKPSTPLLLLLFLEEKSGSGANWMA